jgi:hypothetical protein
MLQVIVLTFIAALISITATSVFLYLMSPFLMGSGAPKSAQNIINSFRTAKRQKMTLVLLTESHILVGSATLAVVSQTMPNVTPLEGFQIIQHVPMGSTATSSVVSR